MKLKALQVGPIGTNCYYLLDEKTNKAAIIDPGDEAEVILYQFPLEGVDKNTHQGDLISKPFDLNDSGILCLRDCRGAKAPRNDC